MKLPKPKTVVLDDIPKLLDMWTSGDIVVSPKADGSRAVISLNLDGTVTAMCISGTRAPTQHIGTVHKSYVGNIGATLIDAELVQTNCYICFDVFSNGCNPSNSNLGNRMRLLNEILDTVNVHDTICMKCKQFFTRPEHLTSYKDLVSANTYPIDGLIFTPISSTNKNIYKWKSTPTIDARVKFVGRPFFNPILRDEDALLDNSNAYEVKIHIYVVNDKDKKSETRFIPPDDPDKGISWLRTQKDESDLCRICAYTAKDKVEIKDGMICEFAMNVTSTDTTTWIPLRVRHDKLVPNTLSVANKVWESAKASAAF